VDLGRDENILVFTSLDINGEIREKLKTKFGLNDEEVDRILLDFSTFTVPVKVTKRIQVVSDDPDDDKFIECALSCDADFIISGDKHLLKMKEYAGIKIFKAKEFLSVFSVKDDG